MECPYCGATEGLRMVNDGGGFIAPSYTCEDCFTTSDDGPCFDDLPVASLTVLHNGKTIELTGLALWVFNSLNTAHAEECKASFRRGVEAAVPDGFTVVPAEPTPRMSAAGMQLIQRTPPHHFHKFAGGIANSIFEEMINASKPVIAA